VGDLLEGLGVQGLSLPIVILIAFLMVFTGRLIPRKTFEDFKTAMELRLKEKQDDIDEWKAAFKVSEDARSQLKEQFPVLIEMGKTQEHLLTAIRDKANEKQ
jgi:hypothetical protein